LPRRFALVEYTKGRWYRVKGERQTLVLYDGVCGLCNRVVRFLLRRDRNDRLRFAALQSALAQRVLARHPVQAGAMDTVLLVRDYEKPSEQLLVRSEAAIEAARALGGVWALCAVLYVLPRFVRDAGYDLIAWRRYWMFGKLESCPLPDSSVQHKFLDV
jgi:predicted DCC family thiol-disulfide oxidoreductase YuxK